MVYLDNCKSRIDEAIELSKTTKENQEVKFIYNEMCSRYDFNEVFEYLIQNGINFSIRHDEYRFVLIINI